MYSGFSKRDFLKTAATVVVGALGGALNLGSYRARAQPAGNRPARLIVGRRVIEVNGKPASVFGIRRPDGTSGLILDPGQPFHVDLDNQAGEPTIIHWHGQTPPPDQDGVVQTGFVPLIPSGANQTYDFPARPGTYWMHSHHGLQEQLLMAAPLIVHTEQDLRADAQEVIVMLYDFIFRDPSEVLAQLTGRATSAHGGMTMSSPHAEMTHGHGMNMPGMQMGGHAPTPMVATPRGPGTPKTGMVMDLNDIDFDAYLANDRTLADPFVAPTERGGRVRLRLINAATSTAFWVDLGTLEGTVLAVDGDPVKPVTVRRFPMAEAQRVDVLLRLPRQGGAFPVLAQREGDRQRTGIVLATPGARIAKIPQITDAAVAPEDLSLERRLEAAQPLAPRPPNLVHRVALTGTMMPYRWSIDDRTWPDYQTLTVSCGQRVELDIVNRTQMAHPMHLHGHHFQVVALNGLPLAGAMRDTVLVPVNGSVRIAFDADNPGRWLFHCHNLYHMATGMMTELVYDKTA